MGLNRLPVWCAAVQLLGTRVHGETTDCTAAQITRVTGKNPSHTPVKWTIGLRHAKTSKILPCSCARVMTYLLFAWEEPCSHRE